MGVASDEKSELFEGIQELSSVLALVIPQNDKVSISVDLCLARGLAYYTGTIFEVTFPEFPEFGSASGGGRYEGLVSRYTSAPFPAVGASIGVTRLMALMLDQNRFACNRSSSAQVLVTVYNEEQRSDCIALAHELHAHDISCEVFLGSPKLGKQIDYADKKGIPLVVFLREDGTSACKNIITKEQEEGLTREKLVEYIRVC